MKSSFLILFISAGILQSCYAGVSYLAPRSHLEELEYLFGFHRPGESAGEIRHAFLRAHPESRNADNPVRERAGRRSRQTGLSTSRLSGCALR